MPKKKSKKVAAASKAIIKTVTRAPTQEVREEEEFSFNYYSKKVVKLKVVNGAESKIVDLKKKKRR